MARINLKKEDIIRTKALNRQLRDTDVSEQLEKLEINHPTQINAIQKVAKSVQYSELAGLPFTIALMKAKLLSDKQIAEELDIPLKAVRKYSQVEGFNDLLLQLTPTIWSDLILSAQATLMYHISVEKNLEAAKWLLESIGQVASSRPQHTHQTLVLNQGAGSQGGTGSPQNMNVENVAEALFQRLNANQKESNKMIPPIHLSHE